MPDTPSSKKAAKKQTATDTSQVVPIEHVNEVVPMPQLPLLPLNEALRSFVTCSRS